MKKNIINPAAKLISLTLILMLLASFTALAAQEDIDAPLDPDTPEVLSGVIYEDEYYVVEFIEDIVETETVMQDEEILETQQSENDYMPGISAFSNVSMNIAYPTLVAGLASNLPITLTGQSIPNGTATVYLDVNGNRVAETPIVNNAATMRIDSMPTAVGTYYVVAWGDDGFIAQALVEVVPYDERLWTPDVQPTLDGRTEVRFIEPVSAKDGTLNGKVTINGAIKNAAISDDEYSIIINYLYSNLCEDDIIVLTGIKYPRLFPSYTFSFTIRYTKPSVPDISVIEVNLSADKEYTIVLNASNITSFTNQIYTLTYDPAKLQLLDFAAQMDGESISAGQVAGTALTIISHSNGELSFTFDKGIPDGKAWSGVITVLRFKALGSGNTGISVG